MTSDAEAVLIAKALRLESFFPEFTGELCAKIFPRSGIIDYPKGEFIITQGDIGRDLFVLIDGSVSVTFRLGESTREIAKLASGAVIGEIALLHDGLRTASAEALVPTRAFRLMFEDMGYVLRYNPELAAHLHTLARDRTTS